jgi:hypothetical protein
MRTRIDSILTAMGLPVRDACELPTSTKTFPDGPLPDRGASDDAEYFSRLDPQEPQLI